MTVVADLSQRLTRLRADFDGSFAVPPRLPVDVVDLLAIRLGGHTYAVRLAEVSALLVDRRVTALPGSPPELLGVAGVRGSIVAVYDLGVLVGYARATAPRWLVLAAGTPPVALAVEAVDGHLRLPATAVAAAADDGTAHTPDVVHTAHGVRPVIDLRAVRAGVGAAVRRAQPSRK